jgi:holliday junction DNA helicase RuvA
VIAYIEGNLVQKEPTFAIIDVGGVGYYIKISLQTSSGLGEQKRCKLFTYLQIREDAHILYGFLTESEKKVFLDLTSVTGVGANTALIMLSSLNAQELVDAIASEDLKTIQTIKGIGKKTAERILLELKDKIKKENLISDAIQGSPTHIPYYRAKNEAVLALVALGIPKNTAEKNIETVIKSHGNDLSVEELIKFALKM